MQKLNVQFLKSKQMNNFVSRVIFFSLCCSIVPTQACGAGGIGGSTSGVIIPVAAVGGTGYVAYKGLKKGADAIKKQHDKNIRRKRNSDIIKTQMSRAVKLVGRPAFSEHIQKLFDNVKASNSATNNFDLGVALFLNKDLIGAEEYLTKSINLAKPLYDSGYNFVHYAHSYFIRGLVNQYLWDFDQASRDFVEAIKVSLSIVGSVLHIKDPKQGTTTNASVPQLTSLDARAASSVTSPALRKAAVDEAPQEMFDDERVRLLDNAIDDYTIAIDRTPVPQGMWHHNRGVARYFRTYYTKYQGDDYVIPELQLALADLKMACNSGNFGTAADGYAMIAQVLTRLKGDPAEIQSNITKAYDADPKVFMVDVSNSIELSLPWPLPRHDYAFKKSPHEFVKTHFSKPTWCSHCMDFIANPVGKQGYECVACKYAVHSKCFPQKTRENRQQVKETDQPLSLSHNHHFKPSWFSKPTWCDFCGKFVVSPVGKQGYTCADCGYKVHKDCASKVPGYVDG